MINFLANSNCATSSFVAIIIAVILGILLILIVRGIKIVPQTQAFIIERLGKYTVDQETPEGAKSHYFHSRSEAIAFLSSLDGQCTLRETTLEDVFVERAGRHLMQR